VLVSAPWLVQTFLGSEFARSGTLLRLLAISAIPGLVSYPSQALLQARGHDRWVAAWLLGVALVSTTVLGVLAGQIGAAAQPLVALIGYTSLMVAFLARIRRMLRAPDTEIL
jgi:O-antigen/teichoic acid export membrane protein